MPDVTMVTTGVFWWRGKRVEVGEEIAVPAEMAGDIEKNGHAARKAVDGPLYQHNEADMVRIPPEPEPLGETCETTVEAFPEPSGKKKSKKED